MRSTLVSLHGAAAVVNLSLESGKGVYAPVTWTSNFYVGIEETHDRNPSFFLAHSLAVAPARLAAPLHMLLNIGAFFLPYQHAIDDSTETDYHHPLSRCFLALSGLSFDHKLDIGSQMDSGHPLARLTSFIAGITDDIVSI